jgi:hypothetical protein
MVDGIDRSGKAPFQGVADSQEVVNFVINLIVTPDASGTGDSMADLAGDTAAEYRIQHAQNGWATRYLHGERFMTSHSTGADFVNQQFIMQNLRFNNYQTGAHLT